MIYSGWLRTWDQCRQNHADCLTPAPVCTIHYDERNFTMNPFDWEEFAHYRENKAPETEPGNTVNMWHNMYCAFELAPRGYDCYVRNRPDILIHGHIDFSRFDLRDDVVYIPVGNDYWEGVNDQFAFGSYKAMEAYHNVYLDHEKHFSSGKMFHSESYLKHTLDMRGIRIERIQDVSNTILRP